MNAEAILAALHEVGAAVTAWGASLHVRAPRGAVTAELRAALVAHKAELLAIVCDHAPGTILCRRCGLGAAEAEPYRDPRIRSGPRPARFRLPPEHQCPRCRSLAARGVNVIGCWRCRWPVDEQCA